MRPAARRVVCLSAAVDSDRGRRQRGHVDAHAHRHRNDGVTSPRRRVTSES